MVDWLSRVGGHGSCGWLVGGSCRVGQLHGESLTPSLMHGCGIGLVTADTEAGSIVLQDPTCGKLVGTRPRSMQAVRDR